MPRPLGRRNWPRKWSSVVRDKSAKRILLKWPYSRPPWRCKSGEGCWYRALPVDKAAAASATPRLFAVGAKLFSTQPDAMWLFIHENKYVDVICVEVFNLRQIFNDLRMRFSHAVLCMVDEC